MPDHALEDRVAIVTGASRGLGRAFAVDLAECGSSVVITARSAEGLAETARMVESCGVRCLTVAGDVAAPATASVCVERAERELGPVDVLVNNAGIADGDLFEDANPDAWWHVFEVNVRAASAWVAAVLPGMRARRRGRIINVSSPGMVLPLPFYSAYCASKAALSQYSACLAVELSRYDIKVFAIGPKAHTDLTRSTYENPAIPARMRDGFRAVFTTDPERDLRMSLDVFRAVTTGAADHLTGAYIGERPGEFDTPQDIASRAPSPMIESLIASLRA